MTPNQRATDAAARCNGELCTACICISVAEEIVAEVIEECAKVAETALVTLNDGYPSIEKQLATAIRALARK